MSQEKQIKKMPPDKAAKDKVKFAEKKHIKVYADVPQILATDDKKWNTMCLPFLGFSVLAFGLALIIVGVVKNIEDLIILGCLFSVGSMIFFVILYATCCRPMFQRNIIQTFDSLQTHDTQSHTRPLSDYSAKAKLSDQDYFNSGFDPNEDLVSARNRPQPSENQLYGEKMRSFLATPATTADVHFFNEDQDTPPPPRLALPSEPGDKTNSVYTMDIDQALQGKSKEMSNLELL